MLQVLVDISLKVLLQKGTWGYTKVIHKKRKKKKKLKKIDKGPRYLKHWLLRCPPEKKER
jgi:hypothetical protein